MNGLKVLMILIKLLQKWLFSNPFCKVHEYQTQCDEGLYILNLDTTQRQFDIVENLCHVKEYMIDHGCSGFIYRKMYYLFEASTYWRLIDDDKRKGVSQSLISDMFKIHQLKANVLQDFNQ